MDLYDLGSYFSGYVPVQARNHSLLRHAACAYAAKQIYLATRQRTTVDGRSTREANMRAYIDTSIDWVREGSFHYDQSISLLRQLILEGQSPVIPTEFASVQIQGEFRRSDQNVRLTNGPKGSLQNEQIQARLWSDDVVAAAIILGVCEFMSNTGAAWSRHLWGTKSLLDTATRPLATSSLGSPATSRHQKVSRARNATFWQFARQDYLAACKAISGVSHILFADISSVINECPTRLDTSDQSMWKEYGLPLAENGLLAAPSEDGQCSSQVNVMPDDAISNTLVWLSCKLCNFIAEGEALNPIPAGDRSETSHHQQHPGEYGKTQAALLKKWNSLRQQFQIWFDGLPDTFEPTSTYKPRGKIFDEHERFMEDRGEKCREFKANWFASSMCASTMQHYHMAQILLVLNKPQETTAARSTIRDRFQSIIDIGEEAVHHCYQIVYVSMPK